MGSSAAIKSTADQARSQLLRLNAALNSAIPIGKFFTEPELTLSKKFNTKINTLS